MGYKEAPYFCQIGQQPCMYNDGQCGKRRPVWPFPTCRIATEIIDRQVKIFKERYQPITGEVVYSKTFILNPNTVSEVLYAKSSEFFDIACLQVSFGELLLDIRESLVKKRI